MNSASSLQFSIRAREINTEKSRKSLKTIELLPNLFEEQIRQIFLREKVFQAPIEVETNFSESIVSRIPQIYEIVMKNNRMSLFWLETSFSMNCTSVLKWCKTYAATYSIVKKNCKFVRIQIISLELLAYFRKKLNYLSEVVKIFRGLKSTTD